MSKNRNNLLKKQKPDLAIKMDSVGADRVETIEEVKIEAPVEDVTKEEVTTEVKNEVKQEVNDKVEIEVDVFQEFLTSITDVPKPPEKVQVTLYLEPAVAKAFDKHAKKHGKGAKSKLVNDFLKKVLQVND